MADIGPGLSVRGLSNKPSGRTNSLVSNASTGSLNEAETDDEDDDEDYDDEGMARSTFTVRDRGGESGGKVEVLNVRYIPITFG